MISSGDKNPLQSAVFRLDWIIEFDLGLRIFNIRRFLGKERNIKVITT